jgi:radical SAM protein with 4Fe4S-binding SPASM domain
MSSRESLCGDDDIIGIEPASAILRTAQTWAHDNLVPLNVSIETTLACNIRCIHCYNFDRDQPRERPDDDACASRPELSTDEILRLMDELRAAGCLFLSLTGGEVFSHPDLFVFLERARALNLAVQLLTNGTMLRPGVAKRLAGYRNLLGVSVSIYGASAAIHDGITQVAGSFARTWAGVERLRAAGVTVRLKFILMRQNAHETQAMMDAAEARGFPYLVDMTITARHDGTSGSLNAQIEPAQLEALGRGALRPLLPLGRRPLPPAEQFTCNCARGNCAISARGEVFPCISVPWSAGNVRDRPFAEIWRDSPVFNRIRGLTLADFPKCAPCPHRGHCSHDRGAAYNATGDYTGADPFVCATAEMVHRLSDEIEVAATKAEAERATAPAAE